MTSVLIKHEEQENEIAVQAISNIYINAASSENTRKAYRQDIRHFISWGACLPTTPDIILHYLYHYAPILNSRTLVRRLTALKNWHCYQGFADPTIHPLVRKTLTGIKNLHGRPKEKAVALALVDLITIVNYLKTKFKLQHYRDQACLQIGFFGALRRSELVAIKFEHLNFASEGVEILIPRSKTDQTGEGQICAIPKGRGGLCPPTALKNWCEKASIQEGPIFRRIAKGERVLAEAISPNYCSRLIKKIAKESGLVNPERYSGHSLRRGFAITAAKQGVSLKVMMQQGRWQDPGTALGYLEEASHFDTNAAGIILNDICAKF